MNGIVRKEIAIVGALVTVAYQDGARNSFKIGSDDIIQMLRRAGYIVPRRYREERDARCLTVEELYEALHLHEIGCSWEEVADVYLVPADDLRSMMRKCDQADYRQAHKRHKMHRDYMMWQMVEDGKTLQQVADTMGVSSSTVYRSCQKGRSGAFDELD